jgi:uncharacterized protein (DUF1499 family)
MVCIVSVVYNEDGPIMLKMSLKRRLLSAAAAAVLLLLPVISCFWAIPRADFSEGELRPCPDRPNCVSSRDAGRPSYIEPLSCEGDTEQAWTALRQVIDDMGGTVRKEQDGYIWASFATAVFRFVDDVEFNLAPEEGVIHIRSEARLGYSDFGVNRKRLETLRGMLAEKMKSMLGNTSAPE